MAISGVSHNGHMHVSRSSNLLVASLCLLWFHSVGTCWRMVVHIWQLLEVTLFTTHQSHFVMFPPSLVFSKAGISLRNEAKMEGTAR